MNALFLEPEHSLGSVGGWTAGPDAAACLAFEYPAALYIHI